MNRIDQAERRRRLAVRHGLASRLADNPAGVARQLVALHATDPATVYLSVLARMPEVTPDAIGESLYERRDLVRMLGMRRTIFVVPAESVPLVQAAATDRIARDQRTLLLKQLARFGGVADPEPWLDDVQRSVLALLAERGGSATASELSAAEPRLRTRLVADTGKAYALDQPVTSRVLFVLAAHGHIVRTRPIGTWLSQQYRWALAETWLTGHELSSGSGRVPPGDADARVELARQWLSVFGPAPLGDLKWWTGWTLTQARQAVAALPVAEVDLDGTAGIALAGDLDQTPEPDAWVSLLPALDPTVMGWSERSWFLGPHAKALFDGTGNAGPTIWLSGRVVGGWAQRPDGEIAIRLLEDVGADAAALIEAEADRVSAWLSGVRVIPRFRTPIERELSA